MLLVSYIRFAEDISKKKDKITYLPHVFSFLLNFNGYSYFILTSFLLSVSIEFQEIWLLTQAESC